MDQTTECIYWHFMFAASAFGINCQYLYRMYFTACGYKANVQCFITNKRLGLSSLFDDIQFYKWEKIIENVFKNATDLRLQ